MGNPRIASRGSTVGPATLLLASAVATVAAALCAPDAVAQPRRRAMRRAVERVVLVVDVLERDRRPLVPCGRRGPQPRDVTARVVAVEQGRFDGERILLSWPMCESTQVEPGRRYRIRIARRTDAPGDAPHTRYLVRELSLLPEPGAPGARGTKA